MAYMPTTIRQLGCGPPRLWIKQACLAHQPVVPGSLQGDNSMSFHELPAGPASLMVWDSMFFGRIAMAGYEYEQFYAFFPLYPVLIRLASTLGAPLPTSSHVIACTSQRQQQR